MMDTSSRPHDPAHIILRVGLGVVFLVFGFWKMSTPVDWILFLPEAVANAVKGIESLDAFGALKLMGFLEAVLGFQLVVGLFTRTTAIVCSFLLAGIVFHVGLTQIGIRDVGLFGMALALCFTGGGAWSLDQWLEAESAAAE